MSGQHPKVFQQITFKHSLCVLMAIFPGGPGSAGTRMSPFRILLQLRVMEVVVTTGAINRHAKLRSNHYHRQTDTQLFTGGCPSYPPINSVRARTVEAQFVIGWMSSLLTNQQHQSTDGNFENHKT